MIWKATTTAIPRLLLCAIFILLTSPGCHPTTPLDPTAEQLSPPTSLDAAESPSSFVARGDADAGGRRSLAAAPPGYVDGAASPATAWQSAEAAWNLEPVHDPAPTGLPTGSPVESMGVTLSLPNTAATGVAVAALDWAASPVAEENGALSTAPASPTTDPAEDAATSDLLPGPGAALDQNLTPTAVVHLGVGSGPATPSTPTQAAQPSEPTALPMETTALPSGTPVPAPADTPVPTAAPSQTPVPTDEPTETAPSSPTLSATATPTAAPSQTPVPTDEPTETATSSPTLAATATATSTPEPTAVPTETRRPTSTLPPGGVLSPEPAGDWVTSVHPSTRYYTSRQNRSRWDGWAASNRIWFGSEAALLAAYPDRIKDVPDPTATPRPSATAVPTSAPTPTRTPNRTPTTAPTPTRVPTATPRTSATTPPGGVVSPDPAGDWVTSTHSSTKYYTTRDRESVWKEWATGNRIWFPSEAALKAVYPSRTRK